MSLTIIAKRKCVKCNMTFTYEIKHNGRTKICQDCKINSNKKDFNFLKYMSARERNYYQDPVYQMMRLYHSEGLTGLSNYSEYARMFINE